MITLLMFILLLLRKMVSTNKAALSIMRLAPQLGQNPRWGKNEGKNVLKWISWYGVYGIKVLKFGCKR